MAGGSGGRGRATASGATNPDPTPLPPPEDFLRFNALAAEAIARGAPWLDGEAPLDYYMKALGDNLANRPHRPLLAWMEILATHPPPSAHFRLPSTDGTAIMLLRFLLCRERLAAVPEGADRTAYIAMGQSILNALAKPGPICGAMCRGGGGCRALPLPPSVSCGKAAHINQAYPNIARNSAGQREAPPTFICSGCGKGSATHASTAEGGPPAVSCVTCARTFALSCVRGQYPDPEDFVLDEPEPLAICETCATTRSGWPLFFTDRVDDYDNPSDPHLHILNIFPAFLQPALHPQPHRDPPTHPFPPQPSGPDPNPPPTLSPPSSPRPWTPTPGYFTRSLSASTP
jgi:hypothetical protein